MYVEIAAGETLEVRVAGTDGIFLIEYGETALTVTAELPDTEGREGLIYNEVFSNAEDENEIDTLEEGLGVPRQSFLEGNAIRAVLESRRESVMVDMLDGEASVYVQKLSSSGNVLRSTFLTGGVKILGPDFKGEDIAGSLLRPLVHWYVDQGDVLIGVEERMPDGNGMEFHIKSEESEDPEQEIWSLTGWNPDTALKTAYYSDQKSLMFLAEVHTRHQLSVRNEKQKVFNWRPLNSRGDVFVQIGDHVFFTNGESLYYENALVPGSREQVRICGTVTELCMSAPEHLEEVLANATELGAATK